MSKRDINKLEKTSKGQKQSLTPEIQNIAFLIKKFSYLPLTIVMKVDDRVQAYHVAKALYLSANLPFPELNKYSLTTKIDRHDD